MKKTALLITALFGASLANAHNVWLEPVKDVKGQYVVKFGHEETETYPQSKLKAVRLLDSKGQLQNATVNFKEGEALFAAPEQERILRLIEMQQHFLSLLMIKI